MILSNDQDTYITASGNTFRFTTGGIERLRINSSGNVKVPDGAELQFGGALHSGNGDLRIFHDSANSYIQNLTNNLIFKNNSADYIRCNNSDGSVTLLENAGTRLQTTTTGIEVTGEVEASQDYPLSRPTLDLNFAATKKLDPRITYQRTGAASFVDKFKHVVSVGDNIPRFDHDFITGESKGLLIEESRINYIKYSHGNGFKSQGSISSITEGWGQQSTTNSTLTQFAAEGPDGTTSALKYTLNATTGRRLDYEGLSTTNGTVYCYSWWMKRLHSASIWSFQQVGGSGVSSEQIFIDGVAASGQTSGYTPPDDEWHRVTWRFTKTGTEAMSIGGYDSSGNTGDRWLLWGAQFEAGSFPTSYIPTDGAAKTRYQDTMRMTGDDVANIYNNTEGTMFYEASVTDLTNDNQPIVAFRDQGNATGNEIAMGYRTGGGSSGNIRTWMRSYVTGSQVNSFLSNHASTGLVGGKPYKHIFGFKKDDAADSYNTGTNSAQTTDTSGNLPVADSIDELRFGAYYSSITTYSLESGHIKRFSYWPVRLTNAQLTTYIS